VTKKKKKKYNFLPYTKNNPKKKRGGGGGEMRLAHPLACLDGITQINLEEKPERKGPLGRHRGTREDNVKRALRIGNG